MIPVFVIILIGALVFLMVRFVQKLEIESTQLNEGVYENTIDVFDEKSAFNLQRVYVYLAGWMLRKNAQDSKSKVQFVHYFLKTKFDEHFSEIGDELVNAMKYNTNIRSVAKWINRQLKTPQERLEMIDYLFELAAVDGEIIDREFVAIVRLAELIGVRAAYVEKKLMEFREQRNTSFKSATSSHSLSDQRQMQQALIALKLTWPCAEKEIKRAFRKQVIKVHPDHFSHLSDTEIKEKEKEFQLLQQAYELLLRKVK